MPSVKANTGRQNLYCLTKAISWALPSARRLSLCQNYFECCVYPVNVSMWRIPLAARATTPLSQESQG
jgi:hypothetical protein